MNQLAAARARIRYLEHKLAEARAELFIARNHNCRPAAPVRASPAGFDATTAPATTRPMPKPLFYRMRMACRRLSRRDRQLIGAVFLGYLGFLAALAVFS